MLEQKYSNKDILKPYVNFLTMYSDVYHIQHILTIRGTDKETMTACNHILKWQHECFDNAFVVFMLRCDEPLIGPPVNTIIIISIPTKQIRLCEHSHNDGNNNNRTWYVSNSGQNTVINVLTNNMDKSLNAKCDKTHKDISNSGQSCRSLETVLLMAMNLPTMNLIIQSLFYCNSFHKKSGLLENDIFTETSLRVAA